MTTPTQSITRFQDMTNDEFLVALRRATGLANLPPLVPAVTPSCSNWVTFAVSLVAVGGILVGGVFGYSYAERETTLMSRKIDELSNRNAVLAKLILVQDGQLVAARADAKYHQKATGRIEVFYGRLVDEANARARWAYMSPLDRQHLADAIVHLWELPFQLCQTDRLYLAFGI